MWWSEGRPAPLSCRRPSMQIAPDDFLYFINRALDGTERQSLCESHRQRRWLTLFESIGTVLYRHLCHAVKYNCAVLVPVRLVSSCCFDGAGRRHAACL